MRIKSVTHNSFCQFIHGEPKHVAVDKLIKLVLCVTELVHTLVIWI